MGRRKIPETVDEMRSELEYYARKANETGNIYLENIEELKKLLKEEPAKLEQLLPCSPDLSEICHIRRR